MSIKTALLSVGSWHCYGANFGVGQESFKWKGKCDCSEDGRCQNMSLHLSCGGTWIISFSHGDIEGFEYVTLWSDFVKIACSCLGEDDLGGAKLYLARRYM